MSWSFDIAITDLRSSHTLYGTNMIIIIMYCIRQGDLYFPLTDGTPRLRQECDTLLREFTIMRHSDPDDQNLVPDDTRRRAKYYVDLLIPINYIEIA